ncbi:MAG: Si-specific NAD(P)(+) transhydrogenase [Bacteroidota bacterium]|nr:Si-specific NAD(P)(+) transhydrogenase [Bacteroidota bacterium]
MSTTYNFDLIVIGSGPAGEKGAAQAAYFGKKTAIIEKAPRVGGAGVNTGTVPSKTLRETALYFSNLRQRGLYGIDYSIKKNISIEDFMYRKTHVVNNEWDLIYQNIERHNIELIFGTASFVDEHTIQVERDGSVEQFTTDFFLIGTGSVPNRPNSFPIDDKIVYDSDSLLNMDRLPSHLAIIGAGVIGCEYATIFSALGISVTLIDSKGTILSFLDHEIASQLHGHLEDLGMKILVNEEFIDVEKKENGAVILLKSGKKVEAEKVLIAAGRHGNTHRLSLENVKIATGARGHISVNEHFQTSVPHIYAAGDVIGFPALASTSMEQARVAVCHAFQFDYKKRVSPFIPLAVYTIPEISFAGETEESLKQKNIPYSVGRAMFKTNARGQIIGELDGMIKLIFSQTDQRLLGVHIIGEGAAELIHLGLFVLSEHLTIDYFIQSVFNFPTLSEAYKYAAYDGLQNLQKMKM